MSMSHDHHNHSHGHCHSHTHAAPTVDSTGRLTRAFRLGIWLNAIYVAVEALFGFITDSMGLLSDAGHNLSDILSLVIALMAIKLAAVKPSARFTYGLRRATVNASVLNAIILYIAVAFILVESVEKLFRPTPVDGTLVAWVAAVGVAINGLTAWLFLKDSRGDLNVRGAFLHMAADALVSVGVVISGIVIALTGWTLIDPIIGIVIAIVIAVGSYGTLRESLRLAFDGVPDSVELQHVAQTVTDAPGVKGMHHLHVWALGTTDVAMTVHVELAPGASPDEVIRAVRAAVLPLGITHSTIEVECDPSACSDSTCNCCTPAKP